MTTTNVHDPEPVINSAVDPAEREDWLAWSDDVPVEHTEADELWWAQVSNEDDLLDDPLDDPDVQVELERWLNSIAPPDDELAARDRVGGAFLGHIE